MPKHVQEQRAALVRRMDQHGGIVSCGLQLLYEAESTFVSEAVHGCVSSVENEGGIWKVTHVSRLYVSKDSEGMDMF